ncbi:hypothetical protein JCM10213_003154 [Rhodosporidiobolus nylandii]
MLETVRSRQIWGFAVLTVLPACAAGGYWLRAREDDRIAASAHAAAASSGGAVEQLPPAGVDERAVRDRIEALRRREKELDDEVKELRVKLERAREKGAQKV